MGIGECDRHAVFNLDPCANPLLTHVISLEDMEEKYVCLSNFTERADQRYRATEDEETTQKRMSMVCKFPEHQECGKFFSQQ